MPAASTGVTATAPPASPRRGAAAPSRATRRAGRAAAASHAGAASPSDDGRRCSRRWRRRTSRPRPRRCATGPCAGPVARVDGCARRPRRARRWCWRSPARPVARRMAWPPPVGAVVVGDAHEPAAGGRRARRSRGRRRRSTSTPVPPAAIRAAARSAISALPVAPRSRRTPAGHAAFRSAVALDGRPSPAARPTAGGRGGPSARRRSPAPTARVDEARPCAPRGAQRRVGVRAGGGAPARRAPPAASTPGELGVAADGAVGGVGRGELLLDDAARARSARARGRLDDDRHAERGPGGLAGSVTSRPRRAAGAERGAGPAPGRPAARAPASKTNCLEQVCRTVPRIAYRTCWPLKSSNSEPQLHVAQ